VTPKLGCIWHQLVPSLLVCGHLAYNGEPLVLATPFSLPCHIPQGLPKATQTYLVGAARLYFLDDRTKERGIDFQFLS
jgi:hypothetical protein